MQHAFQNYRNAQEKKEFTLKNVHSAADLLVGIPTKVLYLKCLIEQFQRGSESGCETDGDSDSDIESDDE
jgi:hypothetical protein